MKALADEVRQVVLPKASAAAAVGFEAYEVFCGVYEDGAVVPEAFWAALST